MAREGKTPKPLAGSISDDREEIRLALVMSGGVSLCVWMGGVALEIDRLRRGVGAYGRLLAMLESTVRVDIISGTSAGGLNGVLMAAAIQFQQPLDGLINVWIDTADIRRLLREPVGPDPSSVLRGDDYFLGQLVKVLDGIIAAGTPEVPPTEPGELKPDLQLTATTSLINAVGRPYLDDFGQVIPERTNKGEFRFTGTKIATDPEISFKLALAARSSASFPGAFEASFCPVGENVPREGDVPERPDMAGVASWRGNRYVIDGGILLNRPVRPALEQILRQPATGPVRRILALVVPDPGSPLPPASDSYETDAPSMLKVVGSASSLPRVQTIGDDLRDIREHNRQVVNRRTVRDELWQLAGEKDGRCELCSIAASFHAGYLEIYKQRWISSRLALFDVPDSLLIGTHAKKWTEQELRSHLAVAYDKHVAPVVASEDPFTNPDWNGRWVWGIDALDASIMAILDLVRRLMALLPPGADFAADHRRALRRQRFQLYRARRRLRTVADGDAANWAQAAKTLDDSSAPGRWVDATVASGMFVHDGAGGRPVPLVDALTEVASAAGAALIGLIPLNETFGRVEELRRMHGSRPRAAERDELSTLGSILEALPLASPSGEAELERMVARAVRLLVCLHVAQTPLLAASGAVSEQHISFVQLSANAPNTLDPTRSLPRQKLTGLQLDHFGAFYKRSWKANDWMWGRLDGAYRLVQAVLSPDRLERLIAHRSVDEGRALVYEWIKSIACGDDLGPGSALATHLRGQVDSYEQVVKEELLGLGAGDPPQTLPKSVEWIARRLQLEIASEELPRIVTSLETDEEMGGALQPDAAALIASYREIVGPAPSPPIPPDQVAPLFDTCRVGEETIEGEVGSDLFADVSSQTLAVAIKAAGGEHGGLGPIRGVLATVRTLSLAIWILIRAVVRTGKVATFVVTTAITLAAALLALRYAADISLNGWIVGTSWIVVAAGLLAAAWRGGTLAYVVVGLGLGGCAVAVGAWSDGPASQIAVVVLAVAAAALTAALLNYGWGLLKRPPALVRLVLGILVVGLLVFAVLKPVAFDAPGGRISCATAVGRRAGGVLGDRLFASKDSVARPSPVPTLSDEQEKAEEEGLARTCDELRADSGGRALVVTIALTVLGILFLVTRKKKPKKGKSKRKRPRPATPAPPG